MKEYTITYGFKGHLRSYECFATSKQKALLSFEDFAEIGNFDIHVLRVEVAS